MFRYARSASVKKGLRIGGSIFVGVLVLALVALRLTGLEPADNGNNSRPGLWLPGEVVTSPVADWSFTDKIPHIMVETRTPFFLPYSVTTNNFSHNGQLYMTATYSKGMVFPKGKFWTSNVARDPRVRLKIDGKVYEMTMVLIADRAEAEAVLESKWQKYAEMRPKGPQGRVHVYRVLQRNTPEYGGTDQP
jgi:hypothetical protein